MTDQNPNHARFEPGSPGDAASLQETGDGEGAKITEAAGDGAALGEGAETQLWAGRTHWRHHAGRLAVWLGCVIALAVVMVRLSGSVEWLTGSRAFAIFGLAAILSGLEVVVRRVLLRILNHRYRLTTQRLFIERGILSQTVDQTELIRVDDVRIHKTFLDRIFGIGSVAILTTDATDREITIEGVREPEVVAEAIRNQMRMMRRKSLFVEKI